MSKINDEIIKHIQYLTAHPDFEGLSPLQMHMVLHFPFSANCPVRFKAGILPEAVSYSPILEACIAILDAIHPDKGLKLTQKGNLPRKVVIMLRQPWLMHC